MTDKHVTHVVPSDIVLAAAAHYYNLFIVGIQDDIFEYVVWIAYFQIHFQQFFFCVILGLIVKPFGRVKHMVENVLHF